MTIMVQQVSTRQVNLTWKISSYGSRALVYDWHCGLLANEFHLVGSIFSETKQLVTCLKWVNSVSHTCRQCTKSMVRFDADKYDVIIWWQRTTREAQNNNRRRLSLNENFSAWKLLFFYLCGGWKKSEARKKRKKQKIIKLIASLIGHLYIGY